MYFLLIIFFAYFYSTIQYNPIEMANNLRKNNGAIPGIRPGKPTSDYIHAGSVPSDLDRFFDALRLSHLFPSCTP